MLPSFLRPLASLGLTVILLVLIAAAMIFGTTYESMVGTPLAQADIYHSLWFDILLGLLAINLIACTLNRYPYRPHQIGWIMTHIGILVILAGAVVSRNWGVEGQLILAEGQASNHLDQNTHQLEVIFQDGSQGAVPLRLETLPRREGMSPKIVDLPNGKGKVTLIRFLPTATGHSELVNNPNGMPALLVKLDAPMASMEQWMWSGDQQNAQWELPMVGMLRLIPVASYEVALTGIDTNSILLFVTPSEMFIRGKGAPTVDKIALGQKIAFGGVGITVKERKDKVVIQETYEPSTGRNGAPALQFSVSDAKGNSSGPMWLAYGSELHAHVIEAQFRFSAQQVDLGFSVQLVKFKRQFYPGTNQPASFASDVIVHDNEKGTFPINISMNNPLVHRGWKFFQSSFIEGTPQYSIFSVAYDPGTSTVYAGSIILIIGLIGIFFVKPYLKKKFPPPVTAAKKEV